MQRLLVFSSCLLSALASVNFAAATGPMGRVEVPVCKVVKSMAKAEGDGYTIEAGFESKSPRAMLVIVKNTGEKPIQLLLQEWSLTANGETSSIVPTDTPNGMVATIQLPPVTLPPGGAYKNRIVMRSHHQYKYRNFTVTPLFNPENTDCPPDSSATLAYVIATSNGKVLEALRVPFEILRPGMIPMPTPKPTE